MFNQVNEYVKRKNELKTQEKSGLSRIVKYGFVAWVAWTLAGLAFTGFCVFAFIHFVLAHW